MREQERRNQREQLLARRLLRTGHTTIVHIGRVYVISALKSGVNARRGRDRFFPTLSMMLDILPEPYRLLISDVRQLMSLVCACRVVLATVCGVATIGSDVVQPPSSG